MRGTKNPLNLFKTAFYRAKNNKKTFPYYGIHASICGKVTEVTDRHIIIAKKQKGRAEHE